MIAIPGAAKYSALHDPFSGKPTVYMDDGEFLSEVQTCKTIEAAKKAADKWQAKENAAVAKSRK